MSTSRMDWVTKLSEVISSTSSIPPDVTFKITEGGVVHDVKVHKMILAMVSPVFRNMLFVHNTNNRSVTEIPIPQTTRPAFQAMIDAIYEITSMEVSLARKTVHEVFTVLILVDMYQIPELVLDVRKYLSTFPLTEDSVVEVASDAMEFLETFQEDAENLLLLCAKFLKAKLTDAASLLRFVAENEDEKEAVHKLLVLMHKMTPTTCPNCGQDPCLNGIAIQGGQFRVGLKVVGNPALPANLGLNMDQMKGKVMLGHGRGARPGVTMENGVYL